MPLIWFRRVGLAALSRPGLLQRFSSAQQVEALALLNFWVQGAVAYRMYTNLAATRFCRPQLPGAGFVRLPAALLASPQS